MQAPLKVMVVDDSAVFRHMVREIVGECPDMEVVAVATNGEIALAKIEHYQPDLITLDFEMPVLDGLGLLTKIREKRIDVGVIMLSALTNTGARLTTSALRLGALDFVLKPDGGDMKQNCDELRHELISKLKACGMQRRKKLDAAGGVADSQCESVTTQRAAASDNRDASPSREQSEVDVVAIGISTGGPAALMETLPRLEAGFGAPILIVQHMPARFTASLAVDLDRACSLHVGEAKNGQRVEAGTVYLAPGGRHLRFRRHGDHIVTTLTDDLPEKSCRPSVDYMFRSVADVWGRKSLGIVMTGMGNDGSDGSRSLRDCGGQVWAQSEESCVIYGMPRVVIEAGLADKVYSLNQIPVELNRVVARGAVPCS